MILKFHNFLGLLYKLNFSTNFPFGIKTWKEAFGCNKHGKSRSRAQSTPSCVLDGIWGLSACVFSRNKFHLHIYIAVHRTKMYIDIAQNDNIKVCMNIHCDYTILWRLYVVNFFFVVVFFGSGHKNMFFCWCCIGVITTTLKLWQFCAMVAHRCWILLVVFRLSVRLHVCDAISLGGCSML